MNRRKRSKTLDRFYKQIGLERIKILFALAQKDIKTHPERSQRYVKLARKIAMRYNIKIPREVKRKLCNKCHSYLLPGANCMVRTRASQQAVIIKCLECNNIIRYPYRREK